MEDLRRDENIGDDIAEGREKSVENRRRGIYSISSMLLDVLGHTRERPEGTSTL